MLKYQDLSPIEKEMVNAEIRSNYSTSSKQGTAYKRITQKVHDNSYCCNCFRPEIKCCCDKIENCFDELDEYEP
jgi:hypothetical protein